MNIVIIIMELILMGKSSNIILKYLFFLPKKKQLSLTLYTAMDKTDSYWEQLQSTESSVQHFLLTQMGGTGAGLRGKSKREGIYGYI